MIHPKKVLIVVPYYPPHLGGIERYTSEIAHQLALYPQWQVVVLTTNDDQHRELVETIDGQKIYRLSYPFKFSNAPFSFSWFSRIKKILKTEKPDVIHIHNPVPGIGDITTLVAGKIPIVITYHAGSMHKGKLIPDIFIGVYEKFVLPFLLRRAAKIVCSSDFVRFDFLKQFSAVSTTITPATDTSVFKPLAASAKIKPTILFVAGLNRSDSHKGITRLFSAATSLLTQFPELQLMVVGDGDRRGYYETQVEQSVLRGHVTFRGWLRGQELVSAYQQATIFVLPTSNDSYPTVVIEAMASGLPVVSTFVGSIPEMVVDGVTGFLVKPFDVESLTQKIATLLSNPDLIKQFGIAGRQRVSDRYLWSTRAQLYLDIYQRAVSPPPTIVQVCGYYPPHIGGLEFVAQTTAQLLANSEHQVLVLTSDQGFSSSAPIISQNLTVVPIKSFEFAHTPFAPGLIWKLLTIPRHSIIHLHLAQAFFPELVLLISKIRSIPYVAHFHLDVEPSGQLGQLFVLYKKIFWKPILSSAQKVIICSEDQRQVVENKFGVNPKNIVVVPNIVNPIFYSDRIYQPSTKELKLLFVGRLTIQKRVDRLIDAMAQVTVPAHLTIVGDGEDRALLESQAKKLKLTNLTFVGAKNAVEIVEYHKNADVLLMSSDREGGTPLVALEAMAGKLPVIGTNVSGVANFLRGVGIIVDDPFVPNFAKTINQLYGDIKLLKKLSLQSATKADQYSSTNFLSQILNVYHDLKK